MSRTVWKYHLNHGINELPELLGPRVRHVGIDLANGPSHLPTVWIEHGDWGEGHENYSSPEKLKLEFIGTGHPVPENCTFLSSVVAPPFVWHVYRHHGFDFSKIIPAIADQDDCQDVEQMLMQEREECFRLTGTDPFHPVALRAMTKRILAEFRTSTENQEES